MAPINEKYKTTKESIKTHKLANTSILISKLETSAPKEIFLEYKILSDFSLLSGTVVSVTPERQIPRQKRNIKSPAISPPKKY